MEELTRRASDTTELAIIEEGLKSPFWNLFTAKITERLQTYTNKLLDPATPESLRSYRAGAVWFGREALNWPGKRRHDLKQKLELFRGQTNGE